MATSVRIIGGLWKRTPVPVAPVDGLRPTPDRVRETLFNWLGQDLTGWRCLEPFAGTGVLGFEAASRGAAAVTLIERDPRLVLALESLRTRLAATAVTVVRGDALGWLAAAAPQPYDLILLDPPYRGGWVERLLPQLPRWLTPRGRVYLEAEFAIDDGWLAGRQPGAWQVLRAGRAGQVHYHLLGRPDHLLGRPDLESAQ
ncbi:MAG: 16S rRNA (guanine(966)-N(2))-methyltransferase RsmD [Lautropia sp.]